MIPRLEEQVDPKRSGFSLIELLVVIAIVAILLGLLMPALASVRRSASATRCRAQLQQLGHRLAAYAGDYRGIVVPEGSGADYFADWRWILFPNSSDSILVCPTGVEIDEYQTYMLNGWIRVRGIRMHGTGLKDRPSSAVVLAGENLPHSNQDYYPVGDDTGLLFYDPFRHGTALRSNFLWLDFHVSNEVPVQALGERKDPWYIREPRREDND